MFSRSKELECFELELQVGGGIPRRESYFLLSDSQQLLASVPRLGHLRFTVRCLSEH